MSSLKKQALHGAFWSFAERFGQQGVQFVISVILARLLEPKDFGVLGMIMIFVALAQSVIDSGFGQALIQKQAATHVDESTVFWFNIASGLAMAAALCAAAPWIASFYDVPLLIPVTRLFSLNLIINSFGLVQNALLTKEMLFKKRMMAAMAGILVSSVVGIAMAWRGYGVWSLIVQGLVMNAVYTIGLWMVHPWRPAFVFSPGSFRGLWKFGSNMLFSGLLTTFFDNIYMVIIGKGYSATELGFYQRGQRLMLLTSSALSQVASQVNFPLMSKMQDDPARMQRAFGKVLQTTMLIVMPMMIGLAVVAPDFIRVLLGEKWMPCVPYLQLLCIVGVFFPIHLLNLTVVLALGRSDIHFRLELIKKVLIILSIAVTFRYGVIAMLWGQIVYSVLFLALNTFYVHRFLQYGLIRQFGSIRLIVAASGLMALAAWGAGHLFSWPAFGTLLLQTATGMVVFLLAEWAFKEPVFCEGLAAVKSRLQQRLK
jgi:O-antigen/teichoic acid export membrane protein